jgi:Flp pilus assembly pilin Flp
VRDGTERRRGMKEWMRFFQEEDGLGVVEIVLIIVVLIAVVVIFKGRLTLLVGNIFDTIDKKSAKV